MKKTIFLIRIYKTFGYPFADHTTAPRQTFFGSRFQMSVIVGYLETLWNSTALRAAL